MQTLRYFNAMGESLWLGHREPLVLERLELGEVEVERELSRGVGQDGGTEVSRRLGGRIITARCCILAASEEERFEMRRRVGRILNPNLGGYLVYNNGFRDFRIDCGLHRSIEFGEMFANRRMQRFEAVFRCPTPFFTDIWDTEGEFLEVVPRLHFPLRIPQTGYVFSSLAGGRMEVHNLGDADTPIRAVIFGPCTNPTIGNETTGERMRILYDLPAGQSIEISTHFANKRIEIVDGAGPHPNPGYLRKNILHHLELVPPPSFFALRPGRNIITFAADIGKDTGRMRLAFNPRYLIV